MKGEAELERGKEKARQCTFRLAALFKDRILKRDMTLILSDLLLFSLQLNVHIGAAIQIF